MAGIVRDWPKVQRWLAPRIWPLGFDVFDCEDLLPVDCVLKLGVCLPDYIEEGVYDTSHDLELRAFQWDKRFPRPKLK